jgi:hypothetical protein
VKVSTPPRERPIDTVGNIIGLIVAIAVFIAMGYGMYISFMKPQ